MDKSAQRLSQRVALAEKRNVRLEAEMRQQMALIGKISGERAVLMRELDSWHRWGLWMADRITYLEQKAGQQ